MIIIMKKNAEKKEIRKIIEMIKPKKTYLSKINGKQILVVN
jgi:hypothetical protein